MQGFDQERSSSGEAYLRLGALDNDRTEHRDRGRANRTTGVGKRHRYLRFGVMLSHVIVRCKCDQGRDDLVRYNGMIDEC